MHIYELIDGSVFPDFVILAGKTGINNIISATTVVDAPDGAKWMQGGEFIITTGYMFRGNTDLLLSFMREVAELGGAGMGLKGKRYLHNVPAAALQLADELGLPLISIPEKYAFKDIINPVLTHIIDLQSAQMAQSVAIHNKFLDLAINDCPIPEVLKELNLILGIPCVFIDTYFKENYYYDPQNSFSQQFQGIASDRITESFLRNYDYYKVANRASMFGYLFFPLGSITETQNINYHVAVEQAAITIILRMQVSISSKYAEERYKSSFVEDLLLNNIKSDAEINSRSQIYHWNDDFLHGGRVAIVDINNLKKHFNNNLDPRKNQLLEEVVSEIFGLAKNEVEKLFPRTKYMTQSDTIAFLICAHKDSYTEVELTQLFSRIQAKAAQMAPFTFTVTLGIGNHYPTIREIHKSYAEARTAINLGYTMQKFDCILFYEKMGLYRMLLPVLEASEAKEYVERLLLPLEQYDKENGQELLPTLLEIIHSGWNLRLTAERTYLHYNSIKYRYKRICEIIGLDLNDQLNRLMVSNAVFIYNMAKQPDSRHYK